MNIDIAEQVGAVVREVQACEREGKPARAILARRTYAASVEETWDAMTKPERVARWFLPLTGDLVVGGRYQLEGNAGGTITACDAPHTLALTWEMGGKTSWVTAKLHARGTNKTELELEHVVPVDDHWEKFGAGAAGVGWDSILLGLHLHTANGGKAVDKAESMVWMGSDNGKGFFRASAEAWKHAAIAGGEADAEAERRTKATIGAYTGEG